MHKIGDIVLTPFPFTDLSQNKVRPALILGTQKNGDDVTVCFISSNTQNKIQALEVLIDSKDKNFRQTGLKTDSTIKVTKIATLDKIVILGQIGKLDALKMVKVKKILKIYLEL